MRHTKFLILTGIILALFVVRVLPYSLNTWGVNIDLKALKGPWNVSPLMSVCLLGGMYFGSRKLAILVPLFAWLLSSIAMSVLTKDWQYLAYPGSPLDCGCFVIACLLGTLLGSRSLRTKFVSGLGLALLSECIFFLVTNAGVWLLFPYYAPEYQYPWTVTGLLTCYEMAWPFFKHSLVGTGIFFPALLAVCELAQRKVPAFQPQPQPAEAI